METIRKQQSLVAWSKRFAAIVLAACTLSLLLASEASSQTIGRVGTTAATFLKVGIGSRSLGMGEAYTTLAEDVSGMYWNPAGTASMPQMQGLYSHYAYLADIKYNFGGVALPVSGFGTVGAFVGYMDYGEIERTTVDFPSGTGETVSASSFVFGVSYSRSLTDRFSIGGNVKYIREGIWHSSASAFAFDIGLLYKTFFRNIRIGMSISNFGSSMKMDGRDMLVQHDVNPSMASSNPNLNAHLDTDEFPLPVLFRVGISTNITRDLLEIPDQDWVVSVDAVHPSDNKEYLNIGTEARLFNRLISLRAGYREFLLADREGGLTLGAGVGMDLAGGRIDVDFATVEFGRFGYHNVLTLILTY